MKKEDLIKEIIDLEWAYFNRLNNIGGRASCQDNREDFEIMRTAQWLTFSEEVLELYLEDVKNENLLFQKYANMMKYTNPKEYLELKSKLPIINDKKQALVSDIMKIYMKWEEEFFVNYPIYSSMGRPLYSESDDVFDTSIETYLRGELETYSENTLSSYLNYIQEKLSKNENLVLENMDNLARLQGFKDANEVENYYKKA